MILLFPALTALCLLASYWLWKITSDTTSKLFAAMSMDELKSVDNEFSLNDLNIGLWQMGVITLGMIAVSLVSYVSIMLALGLLVLTIAFGFRIIWLTWMTYMCKQSFMAQA